MNLTPPKLKPLHIGILTVVLALLIGGPAAYFWIMPMVKANSATEATVVDLEQQANPANETKANADLAKAKKDASLTRSKWQYQEARYFRIGPKNQVLDLASDPYDAADQLYLEEKTSAADAIRRWVKSTGNTVAAMAAIQGPLDWPNPNGIDPTLNKLTGNGLKVQGTFPSIMRLLSSTERCSRLITLDSVILSSTQSQSQDTSSVSQTPAFMFGNGDTVVADINLTIYIYPRNGNKKPKIDLPGGDTTGGSGGVVPGGSGLSGGPPSPGVVPMPGGPPTPGGSSPMPRPAAGPPMG